MSATAKSIHCPAPTPYTPGPPIVTVRPRGTANTDVLVNSSSRNRQSTRSMFEIRFGPRPMEGPRQPCSVGVRQISWGDPAFAARQHGTPGMRFTSYMNHRRRLRQQQQKKRELNEEARTAGHNSRKNTSNSKILVTNAPVVSSSLPRLQTYDWPSQETKTDFSKAPDTAYINSYIDHLDYKLGSVQWTPREKTLITPEEWVERKTPRYKGKSLYNSSSHLSEWFDFRLFILQNLNCGLKSLSDEDRATRSSLGSRSSSRQQLNYDIHSLIHNTAWRRRPAPPRTSIIQQEIPTNLPTVREKSALRRPRQKSACKNRLVEEAEEDDYRQEEKSEEDKDLEEPATTPVSDSKLPAISDMPMVQMTHVPDSISSGSEDSDEDVDV